MRRVLEGGEGVIRGGRSVKLSDRDDAFDRRPSIEDVLDVRDRGGVVACCSNWTDMFANIA